MTLSLHALEDFKKGEHGYAAANGVRHLRAGFVSDDGFFVEAVEDVPAGQKGEFEELPQPSNKK